jgi:hypothetical protein
MAEMPESLLDALFALTPGGSEFVGSPQRCLEFIRDRMAAAMKVAAKNKTLEAELEAVKAREAVGDRMHDLLCRLYASPDYLVDRFAKETWKLMQDWTAPPKLTTSEPPGETAPAPSAKAPRSDEAP